MNALPAMAQGIAVMNPLDVLMTSINTNPYFIGLMMLLLNLGGRFLALEISKDQEKFLSQPFVRRFFLIAVLFVATRNIVIALALGLVVILLLGYLFNENSDLCLWKSCATPKPKEVVQEGFVGLTPEEAMILKRLQDKQAAAQQAEKTPADKEPKKEEVPPSAGNLYQRAIQSLRKLF